jgi:hypothetical protein
MRRGAAAGQHTARPTLWLDSGYGTARRALAAAPEMNLRERLEIRQLADERYRASIGLEHALLRLADRHGEQEVLDWLRAGPPTPPLDVAALDYLLGAGVTVDRYRALVTSRTAV